MGRRRRAAGGLVELDANGHFVCPHHSNELTLSVAFCARLFQRAAAAVRNRDPVEVAAVGPCRGCNIGAAHAGVDAPVVRDAVFRPGQSPFAEPAEVRLRRARNGARVSAENAKQRVAARRGAR